MRIAVIGDFDSKGPSHKATAGAIERSALRLSRQVTVKWIPTQVLETDECQKLLMEYDGIWGAPGDHKSSLGYINGVRVARESNIPYLGT